MTQAQQIRKVMPRYDSLIFGILIKIYEAWDEGNLQHALRRACMMVTFLTRDMKKKLKDHREQILEEMAKAQGVKGYDFHNEQINRNRNARRVAMIYLEPFVDKITDLLDEAGYFALFRNYLRDFGTLEEKE